MNKKRLILFTGTFPFGSGETFLETEAAYYDEFFSEVVVIPVSATSEDRKVVRRIPSRNCRILEPDGSHISPDRAVLAGLKTLMLPSFYRELPRAWRQRGFQGIKNLFVFTAIGEDRVRQIRTLLQSGQIIFHPESDIIYSYWLYLSAYAAIRLSGGNSTVISRCHGFDVYEERFEGYLPYRMYFMEHLKQIYAVSEHGLRYLLDRYREYREKFSLSRLGTLDRGLQRGKPGDVFHLVSCSRVVEVKRIDRVITALSNISIPVRWTHIGGGPLLSSLRSLAERELAGTQVSYWFLENMSNADVLEYYAENYVDCFVNVSSSEGVPVSVMEAMSFGIPVIATDVGGTAEIVQNQRNGLLLPADFRDENFRDAVLEMDRRRADKSIQTYRMESRGLWEACSDAEKKYRKFLEELQKDGNHIS